MDVLTVSNSQIGVWDRCEQQWEYSYPLNLTPVGTKDYFQKGTMAHELLAAGYTAKRNGKEVLPAVMEFVGTLKLDMGHPKTIDNFKAALRIVQRYFRDFSPKEDKFRILDVERHFVVEMMTPKGRVYRIQGYFDLLIEWDGKLWIVDHKTVGGGKFWSFNELMMDPQMSTYILGLREEGYDVFGCMINQLNTYDYSIGQPRSKYKKYDDIPVESLFKRERIYRTDRQIINMATYIGSIVDEMYDHEGTYRKSFRKDCARCPFFTPCLMSTKGMDISAELAVSFRIKEPRVTAEEVGDWA